MLKGQNQIKRFTQVAEQLADDISSLEGVAGIVFLGGLVRGFADKYSDVDVTVFTDKRDEQLRKQIRNLGAETVKRFRVDLDLEIHFFEDFKHWRLGEAYRWELSHANIVFDPKNKIAKAIKEKLKVSKNFWLKRIVVSGEYLKWYCCPPKGNGTVAEAWVDRGDMVSAHYCLTYAADLLISLIFALNKEFLPAPKWRIYYLHDLKWQPEGYKKLLKEAIRLENFTKEDFNRRIRAIRKMWQKTVPKIKEETGLTPESISKYYVEKILHQT